MVATRRGSKKGAGRTSSQKRAGRSSETGAACAVAVAAIRKLWSDGLGIRSSDRPSAATQSASAWHLSGRPGRLPLFEHLDGARSLLRMRAAALKDVCNVSVSRLPEVAPGLATDAVVVDACKDAANCSTLVHLSGRARRRGLRRQRHPEPRCCSTGRGARTQATAARCVAQGPSDPCRQSFRHGVWEEME